MGSQKVFIIIFLNLIIICNFGKDKDISIDEEFDLKTILRNKYKQMIEIYKN